jgi:hypothetical protein
MKSLKITGPEKRVNELQKFLSTYIKVKGLIVEEIKEKQSKKVEEVQKVEENQEKPEKKTTKKKD